ncbi:hypothetical protein HDV02_000842 [Globomyces sp. JEL0801]|nr:hypothetical protein HDV02_000842 [Globomyces sp. JEL0801]
MFSQTYIGDITITPSIPWTEFPFVLSSPTVASVTKYAHAGEQAAWPRIAILRNHCLIERCLSENIVSLRKKLLDEDEQLDQTASNFNWYLPPVLTPNLTNNSGNPEKSDLSFDSMIELETSLEAKPKSQNNRLYVSSGNIRQRFSSINPSGNNPTKRLSTNTFKEIFVNARFPSKIKSYELSAPMGTDAAALDTSIAPMIKKKLSLFDKTCSYIWNSVTPALEIAKDVSSVYGNVIIDFYLIELQRLYNYLISNRNPKKHYQFLAKKACSYEQ